ncbi:MAG: porin family protein [Flavobacterium sp.]
MKKILICLSFFVLASFSSNAQMLKFGIKGGVNFSDFGGSDAKNFNSEMLTGFHVGALVEFNVFENLSLQPEIMYSAHGAKIKDVNVDDINLNYITVPVLAKFYVITDKLSLEAGPQFSFLINESVPDQFESKSFDFAAVGGLGFYFTKNVFAQARYVAGLTDTTKDAKINNQVIQLSIGYRF